MNAKLEGDKILKNMIQVTAPPIVGTHDARMVIVDSKAYIVYYANDSRPGEDPRWSDIYIEMSILDINTKIVERRIRVAEGGQLFDNYTLDTGACFVPNILIKDKHTLRCFFCSENPGKRQSQTWYIDFDTKSKEFSKKVYKAKVLTKEGVFDMQPIYVYRHALLQGFKSHGSPPDYGLYIFDTKRHEGKNYVSLVMFPWGPTSLSILNDKMDTFEILGYINKPYNEMAICFMPNNEWLGIIRNDKSPFKYTFWKSPNGIEWTLREGGYFDPKGSNSKPILDCFNGIYYLGYQSEEMVNGIPRTIYNFDISKDGKNWERKYRIETKDTFHYPSLYQYDGHIWFVVTQGEIPPHRKERIMFGCLE